MGQLPHSVPPRWPDLVRSLEDRPGDAKYLLWVPSWVPSQAHPRSFRLWWRGPRSHTEHLIPHTSHPLVSCTSSQGPVLASCLPQPPPASRAGVIVGGPLGARPGLPKRRPELPLPDPGAFPEVTWGGQGEQEPGLGGRGARGSEYRPPPPHTAAGSGTQNRTRHFRVPNRAPGAESGCSGVKIEPAPVCVGPSPPPPRGGGRGARSPEGACVEDLHTHVGGR